jgi:hypothetical protein
MDTRKARELQGLRVPVHGGYLAAIEGEGEFANAGPEYFPS